MTMLMLNEIVFIREYDLLQFNYFVHELKCSNVNLILYLRIYIFLEYAVFVFISGIMNQSFLYYVALQNKRVK